MARLSLDLTDPISPVLSYEHMGTRGIIPMAMVSRISIDARPGKTIPHLYLEVPIEGTVVLEGTVVERVPTEAPKVDVGTALQELLSRIDPAILEESILAQFDGFGSEMTTGQAALNVLKEFAGGNHPRT